MPKESMTDVHAALARKLQAHCVDLKFTEGLRWDCSVKSTGITVKADGSPAWRRREQQANLTSGFPLSGCVL